MSSKRNVNILADQHHSHSLPPYQPGYTTGPPVLSPVSAPASHQHTPQILPALSSLSNPRYPPPPPPPAPPPLHHSSSQSRPEPQEKQDHGYNGPQSGQATPIVRNHGEPPYHRTSSTPVPSQGQAPPPLERPPMENGHSAQPLYAAPPHPEQHHLMYPPQHHPGPPMMDHGPYGPHPAYHAAPGYMYPSIHMTNQNTRKKSMRASQACDKCRERKSKCDEQRPCATCKEQNIECRYKDSQPSKVDKSNAQITETLQNIADGIQALNDRMNRLEERSINTSEDRKSATTVTFKAEDMSRRQSRNDSPAQPIGQDVDGALDLANLRQPGNAGSYDFAEHTTAAHKLLLRWPSIAKLFNPDQHPYPENYVLHHENRGCLRLYGRGERVHDEDKIAIGAASPAQSARSDESHAPSPDMFNGFDEPKRSEPGYSTSLDMDSRTLYRLFDKYKKHIHRLHPFLDIDVFGKYIRSFINDHNTDSTKLPYSPHNMFIANGGNDSQKAGMKRKRSEALGPSSFSSSDSGKRKIVKPAPRTLSNAIVYLVFALGKVCETGTIPGPLDPVPYSSAIGQAQPGASPGNIRPSPSSPHSVTYGYTPPAGETFRTESRGSSFEDSPGMEKKNATNVDTMPGLNYYREAVSILGDFADANDLASAQARLLAALYKGQLARVQESWGWLYNASRTCQYLIRMEGLNNTYNPQMVFDKNKNLTLLAYWTCLQLESDILAELDYPISGLSSVEGTVNWPNNVLDEEASRKIVSESATELDLINIYYSAQLFLRKHLNQIHVRIYSVDLARRDPKELSDTLDDLDETLQGWRNLPHPITFWDDEQSPHPDILAARLRAKYYGARYVTTRPFLDYALHVMEEGDNGKKLEEVTVDARGKRRRQELVLFQAIQMMPLETIKHKVSICIDSAKKSTIALDAVNDHRLIVTNIMGTAHAQFGNMLVLAAVSRSNQPWLQGLVSMADLRVYLNRTIKFLVKLKDASATATEDLRLLTDLRSNLRLTTHDDDSYNT